MKLYESDFVEITLDTNLEIITNTWFTSTENMEDEDYETDMLRFAELVQIYRPTYHLIKSVDFLYPITIEMQDWTNQTIFPKLAESGIKKIAFLVSSEVITQISIEQVLEESNATAFQVRYFSSEEDALVWIKK